MSANPTVSLTSELSWDVCKAPGMTAAERDALTVPADEYWIVLVTDTGLLNYWDGSQWRDFSGTEVAPGQVTNLQIAAASTSQLNLTWNTIGGATYEVERSANGVSGWSQIATPSSASYNDTGRTTGTQYFYRVRAVNGAGSGPYSAVGNNYTLPGQPQNLSATGGAESILLNWDDLSIAPTNYVVERSANGLTSWSTIASPAASTYNNTGLGVGETWYYRVSAANPGGTGAVSATASDTTEGPFDFAGIAGGVFFLRTDDSAASVWKTTAAVSHPADTENVARWDDDFGGKIFQRPTSDLNCCHWDATAFATGAVGGVYGDHTGDTLNYVLTVGGSPTSLSIGTAHTIFVVVEIETGTRASHEIFLLGDPNSLDFHLYLASDGKTYYGVGAGATQVNFGADGLVAGNQKVLAIRRNGTSVRYYINGVQTGGTQTLGANTATSTGQIGGRNGSPNNASPIGAVLVYNSDISDGNFTNANDALMALYGIS